MSRRALNILHTLLVIPGNIPRQLLKVTEVWGALPCLTSPSSSPFPLQAPTCARDVQAGWCRWERLCGRMQSSSCASRWSLRERPRCRPLPAPPRAPCFQRCSPQTRTPGRRPTSWGPGCAPLWERTPTDTEYTWKTVMGWTTVRSPDSCLFKQRALWCLRDEGMINVYDYLGLQVLIFSLNHKLSF